MPPNKDVCLRKKALQATLQHSALPKAILDILNGAAAPKSNSTTQSIDAPAGSATKCALCPNDLSDKDQIVVSCCKERIHSACYDKLILANRRNMPLPTCRICADRRKHAEEMDVERARQEAGHSNGNESRENEQLEREHMDQIDFIESISGER